MNQENPLIINESERDYYDYEYLIGIGDIGTHFFRVYANDESEAIDIIADCCLENGWMGFFCEDKDIPNYYNEKSEDYTYLQDSYLPAGNESLLFTNEIHFIETRKIKHLY